MEVANTLAYDYTATITAVKSFIVKVPGLKGRRGANTLAYLSGVFTDEARKFVDLVEG
jgi:hypothetical protein